ncbi:hypothetical protein GH733_018600 [Mirounga leonina]|nr:hypothetical protein GH733_018600 [Mirounga leonina]
MAYQSLRLEYLQIPPVSRAYTTACVLTTAAVVSSCSARLSQLELITPFQLYFNPELIFKHFQAWLRTANAEPSVLQPYVKLDFLPTCVLTIFLTWNLRYRYCRMLEEGSFRGRTADFVFMFLFVFLGQAFTIMLVYVWSRRNPYVRMNFFGLLNFQAPFLPWVLMGFSLLLGNSIIVDLLGIAVGHIYFFLEDVFPNQPGGIRILKTPSIFSWRSSFGSVSIRRLSHGLQWMSIWIGSERTVPESCRSELHELGAIFDTPDEDPNYNPLPEERPGGFAWGEGQRLGG